MNKRKNRKPLGQRNNNPFNIVRSPANNWLGLTKDMFDDCRFCKFVSMEYGIRAGLVLLCNYVHVKKLTSVKDIINRFAPPSENDSLRYISFVRYFLDECGTPELSEISSTQDCFFNLARAIMKFESDYDISLEDIKKIWFKFNLNL